MNDAARTVIGLFLLYLCGLLFIGLITLSYIQMLGEVKCKAFAKSHGYDFAFYDVHGECWGTKDGINIRLYQNLERGVN